MEPPESVQSKVNAKPICGIIRIIVGQIRWQAQPGDELEVDLAQALEDAIANYEARKSGALPRTKSV